MQSLGFPHGACGKEPSCQCRKYKRLGFNPWVGEIPGGEHGNPLPYSCLETSIDRGTWQGIVHKVEKVGHD